MDGSFQIVKERKNEASKAARSILDEPTRRCSLHSFCLAVRIGGADRDRTGDPLLAKQVLSQLSYSPLLVPRRVHASSMRRSAWQQLGTGNGTQVVGLGRVELPTSPLSGVRSNQLSYRPDFERACTFRGRARAHRHRAPAPLKQLVLGARANASAVSL